MPSFCVRTETDFKPILLVLNKVILQEVADL